MLVTGSSIHKIIMVKCKKFNYALRSNEKCIHRRICMVISEFVCYLRYDFHFLSIPSLSMSGVFLWCGVYGVSGQGGISC